MEVRKAKLKDLDSIDEIYVEGMVEGQKIQFPKKSNKDIFEDVSKYEKQRLKSLKEDIVSKNRETLVCEIKGEVIGFGIANLNKTKMGSSEISLIFLKKDYQRKGLGGKIMKKLLEFLKKKGAKEVVVSTYMKNKSARKLNEKFGFKDVSISMKKTF